MSKAKNDGPANKAAGPPPNETHADKPSGTATTPPDTTAGVPDPAGAGSPVANAGEPTDAGRYDPNLASGAQPAENAGRDSGQRAGAGVPPAVGGPYAAGQNPTGTGPGSGLRPGRTGGEQFAGGSGKGKSPQGDAESPAPLRVFTFGKPSEGSPALSGSVGGEDVTLGHLTQELRDCYAAIRSYDFWTAARLAAHLLSHVTDAAGHVNRTGPVVMGAGDPRQGEAAAREWSEFEAAANEWATVKGQAVAFAPNAKNAAWHAAGGPTSGHPMPMGSGPAVQFDPGDIMRIVELVQFAVELIRKFRR